MKVLTVGGGPGGLYASLLLRKANPDLEVTVIERNPAGATYGWGVVFSDRTLSGFREADLETYEAIVDRFVLWDAIDIRIGSQVLRCAGQPFAGIERKALLAILQSRCRDLGVELRFETEIADLTDLGGSDLVIAADGVRSVLRDAHEKVFRPTIREGRSPYIWYGAELPLDAFTFIFRDTEHGRFQAHAYPYDGTRATFIVETDEDTWRRTGLDAASEAESIAFCEQVFADDLRGAPLLSNASSWIRFPTLRCRSWRDGSTVLVGDAAHTAHFSIGSGTKLAMEDAISLARALDGHGADLELALADYEADRKPRVSRLQDAAGESRAFFETTGLLRDLDPEAFAFRLLTRSGRQGYDDLRLRDPRFVAAVDAALSRRSSPGPRTRVGEAADARWRSGDRPRGRVPLAPPPLWNPIDLGGLRIPNRAAMECGPVEDASEGVPGLAAVDRAERALEAGAGLVIAGTAAVAPEGRITAGDAGLWSDRAVPAWRAVVDAIHEAGAGAAVVLNHAGPRAATRSRRRGLDLPAGDGAWPPAAASAIPYTDRSPVPEELAGARLEEVRSSFSEAAGRAREAGFDLLLIDMARGYLLHAFLSPLTNVRADVYGGSPESRRRFPLQVFDAVRAPWPRDRPLGAVLPATDAVAGGLDLEDAINLGERLVAVGCSLVMPSAGHVTPEARPRYGPAFLAPHAERIRAATGLPVLCGGGVTEGTANTILAGGRADVCVIDL